MYCEGSASSLRRDAFPVLFLSRCKKLDGDDDGLEDYDDENGEDGGKVKGRSRRELPARVSAKIFAYCSSLELSFCCYEDILHCGAQICVRS